MYKLNKLNNSLIEASKKGDTVKIKSLLKEGADINAIDTYGWNSLMGASAYSGTTSSLDTVRLLLEKGADINAKNDEGWTSLIFSTSYVGSSPETVELLINEGADVNAKSTLGRTSLMNVSKFSNNYPLKIVRLLLDKADVNAKDNWGETSLMMASKASNSTSSLDMIRLLLSYGADPFVKNNKGKYPLDICKTNLCKKIISTSMWNIMNSSIKKSSEFYSTKTLISKDVWKLILLRNKQRQLCKDLNKEENKYVLQGFATMLNIPITENMTKQQLCNLVSKKLYQSY